MRLPVSLRPLARFDAQQIHAEMEALSAGLGDKFLERLQDILARIESMPEMYATVWGSVRAVRLRRFRHVVYYVVLPDRVEVLAVMHGSRDSSVLQSRV
jgi:toxin ParE1/3/4